MDKEAFNEHFIRHLTDVEPINTKGDIERVTTTIVNVISEAIRASTPYKRICPRSIPGFISELKEL